MTALYQLQAGWLNLFLWHLPQPDYWQIAFEQTMRSDVLPNITGI